MAERAKLSKTGGSQAARLPRPCRLHGQAEVLIRHEGKRVLEGRRRAFSRRFLALAGSAKDFPHPPEPAAVEPGPKLGYGGDSQ